MAPELVIAASGLLVAARARLVSSNGRRAGRNAADQTRLIHVDGSYRPSEVRIRAGEPARLIFRRQETSACSDRVVFPDFGISVALPPFEDVAIDLPASEPGEHEFACPSHVLQGRLVVEREVATQ